MHLILPKDIPSEQVENGTFENTGKYLFCGPFIKFDERLPEGYEGVNLLDAACRKHDLDYKKYKNTRARNIADDILADEASVIATDETKPDYQRKDARLDIGIMGTKSRFGLGNDSILSKIYYDPKTGYTGINDLVKKTGIYKKDIENWLENQDTYALHKLIRHKFPTRCVIVNGIDDQWQAGLVEMRNYKDMNQDYILTVIDVFSKYAWAIAIKNKSGHEVSYAFQKNFKERKSNKLHTYKGAEFINRSTKPHETKAEIVERFHITLKNRIWRYFTKQGNEKQAQILPDSVKNYKTSYHRSINMSHRKSSLKENGSEVYKKNYFLKSN